jgi:hypothetical protein
MKKRKKRDADRTKRGGGWRESKREEGKREAEGNEGKASRKGERERTRSGRGEREE